MHARFITVSALACWATMAEGLRRFRHAAMEIAQVAPQLLEREAEREEAFCYLAGHAARQTLIADRDDCRRVGIERRFYAIEVGRLSLSEKRSPARPKKILHGRSNVGDGFEARVQAFGQRRDCGAPNHDEVVAQPQQRAQ
jgi:hypothetical protein